MRVRSLHMPRIVAWAIALIAIASVLGWYVFHIRSSSSFQTLIVEPATFVQQVTVSGTVVAQHDVALGFAGSGRIGAVFASVGMHVSQGTILASIENADVRAQLAQKQAILDSERATLASLLAGTRQEDIAVSQAAVAGDQAALAQAKQAVVNALQTAYTQSDDAVHNKVDAFFSDPFGTSPKLVFPVSNSQAEVNIESDRKSIEPLLAAWRAELTGVSASSDLAAAEALATANLSRVSALLLDANTALNAAVPSESGFISAYETNVAGARSSIDATTASLTSAIAAEAAARAALDRDQKALALKEASSTPDTINAQQALVAASQADVAAAQAAYDKTLIKAPFAGVVTNMDVNVGEVVSPGFSGISMISDGLLQIQCYIPELQIGGVSTGDSAQVTLDALGDSASFPAKVVAIDPAETVRNGVSTYKTTLEFLAPDPRLRSGMTGSVVITSQEIPNAFAVPQGAVFVKNGQEHLQVLRDGSPTDVPVVLGAQPSLGNVQVVSGLSAGDILILNPDTSR